MSSRVVEKYLNGVSLADLDSQNSPGSDDWELEIPMNKSWRSNESEGEDVKVGYFEAPTGSEDPWKDAVAATDNNFDEDDATHRRIATVKELEESSENVPEMKAHFPETSDQDLGTDSGTTGAKFVEPAPSSDDDFS